MKKQKKLTVAVLTFCMLTLAACGGNSASDQSNETQTATEETGAQSGQRQDDEEAKEQADTGRNEKIKTVSEETVEPPVDNDRITLMSANFDYTKYDDEYGAYFECHGSNIACTPETGTTYPALDRTLKELAEEEEKSFKQEVDDNDEYALEFASENAEYATDAHYSRYANDYIKRADDKSVSILRVSGGFLGGAHPDYYYEAYNIDPATGELISFDDVVKDETGLKKLLWKKLYYDYPDVEFFDMDEMTELIFTLDPDGIAFYFSPYGVSPYAYGDQVVKVLYDEEPELFKSDYSVDGAYISYLTEYDNKYALDGDAAENIVVEKDGYDGYYAFNYLNVYKDGSELMNRKDLNYYSHSAFLVHTSGGKDYVYIVTEMDNDYEQFLVCGLDEDNAGAVQLDDRPYRYDYYYDEETDIYGSIYPLYPDDLTLSVHCDLLSTYSASGRFVIGDDGLPVLQDEYLTIPYSKYHILESVEELRSDIVDEDGRVTEKDAVIPKGEKYSLYRTDGIGWVDARLSDGRIVRMKVSNSYPRIINGYMSEEDLFEMLYYAG